MSFLRSRAEQLADHLRGQIQRGELVEPLPNTRDWARQLSVSCTALYEALHTLSREKLIVIAPRKGVRLNPTRSAAVTTEPRIVRLVQRGADYPDLVVSAHLWGLLSQRLQAQSIQFSVEKCTDRRLRELCDRSTDESKGELLLLRSLSEEYQRMFWRSGKPCLLVGYPSPRVPLPYVTTDLEGAIRHATNAFLRRGFRRLHLLINRVHIPAVERQCQAFTQACVAWPRSPEVAGGVRRVPLQPDAQLAALVRFAAQVRKGDAMIVVGALSIGAVMTSLLARGMRIPADVELVAVDAPPASLVVWPPPVHYTSSTDGMVAQITRAAAHYFKTGKVPDVRKTIAIEPARPPGLRLQAEIRFCAKK